jgi:deoxyribonuclease V
MLQIKNLHDWNLSCKQAVQLQKALADKVVISSANFEISTVAGFDCSISPDKNRIIAGIVVMKFPECQVIETACAVEDLVFPYVPGLLSFREAPACIKAWQKLNAAPDIVIVDGQGIAHPRRLGLASHLGLFFDVPTIGCAKSRLIGEFEKFDLKKGDYRFLYDKDEKIGAVVCTRDKIKPVFVSPGHKCSHNDAISIVLKTAIKYRLPEPTRQAHIMVGKIKTLGL